MRRSSVETTAMLRHVRGALLWAAAFSAAAGVCVLALPLTLAVLVTTTAPRLATQDSAIVLGFLLTTYFLAAALLAARDRIVTRAALWLAHSLGQKILAQGLEVAAAPNDIEQDRAAVRVVADAIAGIGPLLDCAVVPVALLAIMAVAPLAGLGSLTAVAGSLLILFIASHRASRDDARIHDASATADGIWRTAAASSVAIAARGLTASTVASWSQANGRAIARSFKAAETQTRFTLRLRLWHAVTTIGLMVGLLWLVQSSFVSHGAAVAVFSLHVVTVSVLGTLSRAIPRLVGGRGALARLNGGPARDDDRDVGRDAGHVPTQVRPATHGQPTTRRLAEAS